MFELRKHNLQAHLHEDVKQCYICDTRFQRWNWRGNGRHQCRICSKAVCGQCSAFKIVAGQKIRCCIASCSPQYGAQDFRRFQKELSLLFNERWLLPIMYDFYGGSPFNLGKIAGRLLSGSIIATPEVWGIGSSYLEVESDPKNDTVFIKYKNARQQARLISVLKYCFNMDQYMLLEPHHILLESPRKMAFQGKAMQQMILVYHRLMGGPVPLPPSFSLPPHCDGKKCYEATRAVSASDDLVWKDFHRSEGGGCSHTVSTFYCLVHYRFGYFKKEFYNPPQRTHEHAPC